MGKRMELLKSLAQKGSSKMVLLVMDGLGGLPSESGQTELEKAYTPNMDEIAAQSECGLLEMVEDKSVGRPTSYESWKKAGVSR